MWASLTLELVHPHQLLLLQPRLVLNRKQAQRLLMPQFDLLQLEHMEAVAVAEALLGELQQLCSVRGLAPCKEAQHSLPLRDCSIQELSAIGRQAAAKQADA